MNHREQLLSIGYREWKPGQWLKPVGSAIAVVRDGEFFVRFLGLRQVLDWSSVELDLHEKERSLRVQVLQAESDHCVGFSKGDVNEGFAFLGVEDSLGDLF